MPIATKETISKIESVLNQPDPEYLTAELAEAIDSLDIKDHESAWIYVATVKAVELDSPSLLALAENMIASLEANATDADVLMLSAGRMLVRGFHSSPEMDDLCSIWTHIGDNDRLQFTTALMRKVSNDRSPEVLLLLGIKGLIRLHSEAQGSEFSPLDLLIKAVNNTVIVLDRTQFERFIEAVNQADPDAKFNYESVIRHGDISLFSDLNGYGESLSRYITSLDRNLDGALALKAIEKNLFERPDIVLDYLANGVPNEIFHPDHHWLLSNILHSDWLNPKNRNETTYEVEVKMASIAKAIISQKSFRLISDAHIITRKFTGNTSSLVSSRLMLMSGINVIPESPQYINDLGVFSSLNRKNIYEKQEFYPAIKSIAIKQQYFIDSLLSYHRMSLKDRNLRHDLSDKDKIRYMCAMSIHNVETNMSAMKDTVYTNAKCWTGEEIESGTELEEEIVKINSMLAADLPKEILLSILPNDPSFLKSMVKHGVIGPKDIQNMPPEIKKMVVENGLGL